MSEQLVCLMANLEERRVLALVRELLETGADPQRLLEACRDGLAMAGQRYEAQEYYLSELIMAGNILKQVSELLAPRLQGKSPGQIRGKVVIGTVKGDIHDIGKNVVVTMLRGANYEVFDLGVDVPGQRFIDSLLETGARILGLSGLLTVSFDPMREIVASLKSSDLRDKVKVMIGGGPVTDKVREYTGADVRGRDAQEAVRLCHQWMQEARE